MIIAVHTLIYSDDPPATRAFLRDVVQWPYVIDPGSSGDDNESAAWLIFRTGPSELGVHPTSGGEDSTFRTPRHHSITLMCDDLDATIAELASRGAQFATDPVDEAFGRIIFMQVPGADDILLYEARHETAHDMTSAP
ncbi:MAG: VOC family protein [Micrococcales bacterium]|nr:VOC family protein [Micrococcales bacterium]